MSDLAIPASRTTLIKGAAVMHFPYPKDPGDNAWFKATFDETLESVTSVSVSPSSAVVGTSDDAPTLTVDKRSVQFKLSGGTSGMVYTLTFVVVTTEGSTLHRTVTLMVTSL